MVTPHPRAPHSPHSPRLIAPTSEEMHVPLPSQLWLSLPLFLSGPPGVGKSQVGARLASLLSRPHIDLDTELEIRNGMGVQELIATNGESAFRAQESDLLQALIRTPSRVGEGGGYVLSLGGGSVLSRESRRLLLDAGLLITLWAPPERLSQQLCYPQADLRPLLGKSPTPLQVAFLQRDRFNLYRRTHLWFDNKGGERVDEVTTRILQHLTLSLPSPPPDTLPSATLHTLQVALRQEEHPGRRPPPLRVAFGDLSLDDEPIALESQRFGPADTEVTPALSLEERALSNGDETLSRGSSSSIDHSDLSAQEAITSMKTAHQQIDICGYPVMIRPNEMNDLVSHMINLKGRLFIISDENVSYLHGWGLVSALQAEGSDAHLLSFQPGEHFKRLSTVERLAMKCLSIGVSRQDWVIALGGGITGDIAGFLAATLLRGLKWALIPTSLLAQVDSSIGGKTAVNLTMGKNLMGAFYPPKWVWIDPDYLKTLPRRHLVAGWAEAVKHGVIGDPSILDWIEEHAQYLTQPMTLPEDISSALMKVIEVKAKVVSKDERELNQRVILNFGHTLGHALEAALDDLVHGEAVSLGICFSLEWSASFNGLSRVEVKRVESILKSLSLPTNWRDYLKSEVFEYLKHDKKVDHERLSFIVTPAFGRAKIEPISVDLFCARLRYIAHSRSAL